MISVGASGGIFGLIGACLADIYMNWGLLFNKFVNGKQNHGHIFVLLVLLMDIVVNSLIGLTPFVDNFTRKYSTHDAMSHFTVIHTNANTNANANASPPIPFLSHH
jgi:membrane associated rhomboid family serine protease